MISKRCESGRETIWDEEGDWWQGKGVKENKSDGGWIWSKYITYMYENIIMQPIILLLKCK
jgi:hypothetical protein